MIGYLRGRLINRIKSNLILLDVNGVGYEVNVPASGVYEGEVVLYIHTQVREDAITLFGFESLENRDIFLVLLSVQGVGAKVAMNLLAIGPVSQLLQAIISGDTTYLLQGEGIGPKLAKRLASELKDKPFLSGMHMLPKTADTTVQVGPPQESALISQALSALVNLGYGEPQARAALERVQQDLQEGESIETWVREGLKQLSKSA